MKKLLAFGIMLVFIGLSIVPSTGTVVEKSYVNFLYAPHDPIYINGNDNFTSENGVTGGSGTSYDPYVIEDWDINASSHDGVIISNVSVYFTIRNCYIYGGGTSRDGIVFINVTHGIINDTIINGNRNGIMFRDQHPQWQENSSYNFIHQNTITNNANDGIHFEHTLIGHHSHNWIYFNNITGNNQGIYMVMSAYNHIFSNNLISNSEWGVNLTECMGGGANNRVYHNNFIDNGDEDGQACVWWTLDNDWDDGYPSGGNFWSDYDGIDNFSGPNQDIPGSDGIGDTPHNIYLFWYEYELYPFEYDYYPLMEPWSGNRPPIALDITGPHYGRPGVNYTFCVEGVDPDGDDLFCMWNWDDGTSTGWLGPYASGEMMCASHAWSEEGTYTIRVKLKDIYGNESDWLSHVIIIEAGVPYVEITKPKRALYIRDKKIIPFIVPVIIGDIQIWFWAEDSKSGLNRTELYIDDELKEIFTVCPKSWLWNETTPLKFRHRLELIAYDNAGNNATKKMTVWKFF